MPDHPSAVTLDVARADAKKYQSPITTGYVWFQWARTAQSIFKLARSATPSGAVRLAAQTLLQPVADSVAYQTNCPNISKATRTVIALSDPVGTVFQYGMSSITERLLDTYEIKNPHLRAIASVASQECAGRLARKTRDSETYKKAKTTAAEKFGKTRLGKAAQDVNSTINECARRLDEKVNDLRTKHQTAQLSDLTAKKKQMKLQKKKLKQKKAAWRDTEETLKRSKQRKQVKQQEKQLKQSRKKLKAELTQATEKEDHAARKKLAAELEENTRKRTRLKRRDKALKQQAVENKKKIEHCRQARARTEKKLAAAKQARSNNRQQRRSACSTLAMYERNRQVLQQQRLQDQLARAQRRGTQKDVQQAAAALLKHQQTVYSTHYHLGVQTRAEWKALVKRGKLLSVALQRAESEKNAKEAQRLKQLLATNQAEQKSKHAALLKLQKNLESAGESLSEEQRNESIKRRFTQQRAEVTVLIWPPDKDFIASKGKFGDPGHAAVKLPSGYASWFPERNRGGRDFVAAHLTDHQSYCGDYLAETRHPITRENNPPLIRGHHATHTFKLYSLNVAEMAKEFSAIRQAAARGEFGWTLYDNTLMMHFGERIRETLSNPKRPIRGKHPTIRNGTSCAGLVYRLLNAGGFTKLLSYKDNMFTQWGISSPQGLIGLMTNAEAVETELHPETRAYRKTSTYQPTYSTPEQQTCPATFRGSPYRVG